MKRIIVDALLVVTVFSSICQAECVESKKGKKYHKVCQEDGVIESEEIRDEKEHIKREWENEKLTFESIWDVKQNNGMEKKYLAGKLVESRFCDGHKSKCVYDGTQRTFIDGQLRYEENYKKGIRDGMQREWHENGQIAYEGRYKDGALESFKKWDEDGTKRRELKYKNGHYVLSDWDESGQLRAECSYVECFEKGSSQSCKLDGVQRIWYGNGQLIVEREYEDGTRKENFERGWHSNGKVAYEYSFNKEGKINMEKEWDEYGTLRHESEFIEKENQWKYKKWYKNGQLGSEESYKDGKRDGVFRLWDAETGEQECEYNYKDGKMVGSQKSWHKGELESELHYKIRNGKSVLSGEQKWNYGKCSAIFQSGTLVESSCEWSWNVGHSGCVANQYDIWDGLDGKILGARCFDHPF